MGKTSVQFSEKDVQTASLLAAHAASADPQCAVVDETAAARAGIQSAV